MAAMQDTFVIAERVYDDAHSVARALATEPPSARSKGWPPVLLGVVLVAETALEQVTTTVLRVFRGAIMREDGPNVTDALLVALARADQYVQWMRACVSADMKSSDERIEKMRDIYVERLLLWPAARALGSLQETDLLNTGVELEASAHAVPVELVWAMIELHDALVWAVDAFVLATQADKQANAVQASAMRTSLVRESLRSIEFSARAQEHMAVAAFRREQRRLTDESTSAALRRVRWSLRSDAKPRISAAPARRA